ncbi:hypothetical protein ABBQ38_005558 [Trebouxia sp. C0009 RCD-2024]
MSDPGSLEAYTAQTVGTDYPDHLNTTLVAKRVTMWRLAGRTCSQQVATIDDIDRAGLLPIVLNWLSSLQDLIRCSAVSQAWKEASQNTKPEALHVQIDNWSPSQYKVTQALEILQWLQLQHRRGRFCNLRALGFDMEWQEAEPQQTNALEELSRSFLTLAGSWDLHVCALTGCFTLQAAVELLPSSLLHIALQFTREPCTPFDLGQFARFRKLHTLQLDTRGHGSQLCLWAVPSQQLMSPLTSLRTLDMSDHVMLLADCDICMPADLFPSLQHLSCYMHFSNSTAMLQKVLDIPNLEHASLRLSVRGFSRDKEVVARIGASSKLWVLLLKPFVGQRARQPELKLQLTVDQPLLAYQCVCNDAISLTNNFNSTYIYSVYTPPILFSMDPDKFGSK